MRQFFLLSQLILFFNICAVNNCAAQSYGLVFLSHDLVTEKRTSLNLFPDKPYAPAGNFKLSFDLALLPNKTDYFGYIFRIVDENQRNLDFVFSSSTWFDRLRMYNFKLIDNERPEKIAINVPKQKLYDQWHRVNLTFDYEQDRLILQMNNLTYIENHVHLKKASQYKFIFGVNNETSDCPPMKIRNVKLTEEGKDTYYWPLNDINGNTAKEVIHDKDANVINPLWLRSQHRNWALRNNIQLSGLASVAFNETDDLVYVIGTDSLWTYNLKNSKLTAIAYKSGKFPLQSSNESVYDPRTHKLYNYYVDQVSHRVSVFDFKTLKWDNNYSYHKPNVDNWHTNSFISSVDSSLYIVGGYGHHFFKNGVKAYNTITRSFKDIQVKGDFFYPRYLAAAGDIDDGRTAYFLGGYGSKTGQQILNPKYLYDLMRFDVKTHTFKKIYDLKLNGENFVFANSMIIDKKSNTFRTLVFPNKYYSNLQLLIGHLDNPDYRLVGTPIPFEFSDINSFANLYYSSKTQQFITVTILSKENKATKVKIYSLLSPPDLSLGQVKDPAYKSSGQSWLFWTIVIITALGIISIFLWYRLKSNKKAVRDYAVKQDKTEFPSMQPKETPETNPVRASRQIKENAIYLFGDLKLLAADGTDMMTDFTTLLKELFLIILLDSVTSGRGVSNERLIEVFWPNKTEDSARNNRASNLSRLKSILTQMGNIHLSKDTGDWKITVDTDGIYFDYYQYMQIVSNRKHLTKDKIDQLMDITQRGNFLANFHYPWLDQLKSEVTNQTIDIFLEYANALSLRDYPEFLLRLADSIFHMDSVNEEAMLIKCKVLAILGKHSLAKHTFECFIKEYRILYGEEFKRDFQSILG